MTFVLPFVYFIVFSVVFLTSSRFVRVLKENFSTLFAIINIAGTYCIFFKDHPLTYGLLLAAVGVSYLGFNKMPTQQKVYSLIFWLWIGVLLVFKVFHLTLVVGISFLTFRVTYLFWEVKHKRTKAPQSFFAFMGYVFYPLTFLLGPISRYKWYEESLGKIHKTYNFDHYLEILLRFSLGLLKLLVLSKLIDTVSLNALTTQDYADKINFFQLYVAAFSTFVYMYFTFSGFIDIVIALSKIINIDVEENFHNPFKSTNIQDFWQRWHMTLTRYLKDVYFTPVSFWAIKKWGLQHHVAIVAIVGFSNFLLIGLWHEVNKEYFILGCLHGLTFSIQHLFKELVFKRVSGKPGPVLGFLSLWGSRFITLSAVSFITMLMFKNLPTLRSLFNSAFY